MVNPSPNSIMSSFGFKQIAQKQQKIGRSSITWDSMICSSSYISQWCIFSPTIPRVVGRCKVHWQYTTTVRSQSLTWTPSPWTTTLFYGGAMAIIQGIFNFKSIFVTSVFDIFFHLLLKNPFQMWWTKIGELPSLKPNILHPKIRQRIAPKGNSTSQNMQAFRFEPLPQAAAAEFGAFQSDQGVRDQGRCFREDPGRENPSSAKTKKLRYHPFPKHYWRWCSFSKGGIYLRELTRYSLKRYTPHINV